ncbi:MAG TPA: energy transducer TonB [Steroidobacter sp.]
MIDWRDPDGRPERKITALSVVRWTTAAIFVVAAHGAGVWLALSWKPATASGEPPPAVMIELAPLAVSPDEPPQEIAPGPQMVEAEPEPTLDVPDKPLEKPDRKPAPVVEEVKKPVEEVPPLPVRQPQVEIPKLPEKEQAEAVLTPPPPQPKQEKRPPPKVETTQKKKPLDPNKPRAPQTTAPPTSQTPRANTAAAPFSNATQNPSMSPASWQGALMAHLNRYKRFPHGAAGTGVVTVAFSIDRSGRVLSSRLVRSSGDPVLDADAVSLPRRASPVPAPPPNIGGGVVTLTIPFRYSR